MTTSHFTSILEWLLNDLITFFSWARCWPRNRCTANLLVLMNVNMALAWQEMQCDKIQGLQMVKFLRKRKRPRKSWNLFNFYAEACEHYARTTCVNSDLKTQRWKLDNVKSTQEFTRVKFYFYVRFQFLRTLTCVDKNATVEIHL